MTASSWPVVTGPWKYLDWALALLLAAYMSSCQKQACCAFLTFEMHEETDGVTLTIKAPEEVRSTVDVFFEPFLPPKAV